MMATDYQMAPRDVAAWSTSLDEFDSNDRMSTSSGMTSETASLHTPNDSPYASVIEVVSSDMDEGSSQGNIDVRYSAAEDDFTTPRPRQIPFLGVSAGFESPSKIRTMSRVVGKAKTLVKALVRRRKDMPKFEEPSEAITASASSSAVPGQWRDTMRSRPVMSILVRSHTVSDFATDHLSRRMHSDASNISTTGIYTPEDTTPNPSLDSLVPGSGAAVETFSHMDEPTAQSLAPAGGTCESSLFQNLARVLLFVPWCITVGGTILLFPRQLDRVVFRSGYVAPPAPGLRRLQFWLEMAPDYVKIFLFTLAGVFSLRIEWGAIVTALVAARFAYVWQRFEVQACCLSRRLGLDDMESLWVVVQDPEYLDELFELGGISQDDLRKLEDVPRLVPVDSEEIRIARAEVSSEN
ncbi:hypothetical protein L227DRAFT_74773 [Lentinus tigrinus ALCF2SS1-6]|uniref:Uncharacterized protein n=1 Tax=Lentinus tigrinus ALCF2SS1-6 TaxID=1328759 RepID=A0A5C2SB58_9APHY|nr:hypothetical protein L227DRAFT_74773 [Lentinus tigrinus ALCF2SS1-6]